MFDELADIAVGQEIPGLVDKDQLEPRTVAEIHGLLDLIDQLKEDNLLQMTSITEMLKLEHGQITAEGH